MNHQTCCRRGTTINIRPKHLTNCFSILLALRCPLDSIPLMRFPMFRSINEDFANSAQAWSISPVDFIRSQRARDHDDVCV